MYCTNEIKFKLIYHRTAFEAYMAMGGVTCWSTMEQNPQIILGGIVCGDIWCV